MPDVTFRIGDLTGQEDAEGLEGALARLDAVREVNVDAEKGLLAVSYEGGQEELEDIREAISGAGHEHEPSPGARKVEED